MKWLELELKFKPSFPNQFMRLAFPKSQTKLVLQATPIDQTPRNPRLRSNVRSSLHDSESDRDPPPIAKRKKKFSPDPSKERNRSKQNQSKSPTRERVRERRQSNSRDSETLSVLLRGCYVPILRSLLRFIEIERENRFFCLATPAIQKPYSHAFDVEIYATYSATCQHMIGTRRSAGRVMWTATNWRVRL